MSEKVQLDAVAWDAELPEDGMPWIPIISPEPNQTVEALIVTPQFVRAWTHYWGGRTVPCLGDPTKCSPCKAAQRRRWKAWFGCWAPKFSRYVLLEVTQNAADSNKALFTDPDRNFRGMKVSMFRKGKHRNAPVLMEISPQAMKNHVEPPAEFDVKKALLRIWNGKSKPAVDERPPEDYEEIPL